MDFGEYQNGGSVTDDQAVDDESHAQLLRSIRSLNRKRKVQKKSVPKGQKLGKGENIEGVSFEDLVESIEDRTHLNDLKKQLSLTDRRNKVLHAPVHRQQKERIERSVAYSQVAAEVQKWEDIVKANRSAETLNFPLNQVPYRLESVAELVADRFQPRTSLEIETAKILQNSKHNLTNKEQYTEAEKELLKAMSLKEAKARTAEIQKARALMSYRESKFRQQKKIKSKRYHRLLKRQRRKQMLKEFEELRTKDPEAAKEKIELLERDRILERAILKHRGTNAWAKQMRLHARRDPKTKEMLNEQLRLGKELKQKHHYGSGSSSDSDLEKEENLENTKDSEKVLEVNEIVREAEMTELIETRKDNPWLLQSLSEIRGKSDERNHPKIT